MCDGTCLLARWITAFANYAQLIVRCSNSNYLEPVRLPEPICIQYLDTVAWATVASHSVSQIRRKGQLEYISSGQLCSFFYDLNLEGIISKIYFIPCNYSCSLVTNDDRKFIFVWRKKVQALFKLVVFPVKSAHDKF